MVLLLEVAAELCPLANESADRGMVDAMEVIVLVRLLLVFNGTGGGMARIVELLLMLRRMVGPLSLLFVRGLG